MDNQHKQRIVGTLVMVFALLMLLFFLLRSPSVSVVTAPATQGVSLLAFDLPNKVSTSLAVQVPTKPVPTPVSAPIPASISTPSPRPISVPTAIPAPAASTPTLPVAPLAPVLAPSKVPPPMLPAPIKTQTPELRALQMMVPEAWVVQVGTFSSSQRANRLVTRLRTRGFDVYTRTSVGSRYHVNVFVGPKIHRKDIETIRTRLEHDFHIHGIIRKYQL